MWLRYLRSWLGLTAFSKTRRGRPRSARLVRLRPERLEDRITPTGQKIAYLVAGLGGQAAPGVVFPQALVSSLKADGFEVDLANWNSSDYRNDNTGAYNSYATGTLQSNVGSTLFGNPGSAVPAVTASFTTPSHALGVSIPSFSIPTAVGFQIDIGSPTQDAFVNATVNRLKTFGSQDTIVLIGHSLGGNAALSVAQKLSQQAPAVHIALLGLLDPVGYAPSNGSALSAIVDAPSTLANLSTPSIPYLGVPAIGLQPITFKNGISSNANNETPGFRGNEFGGGVTPGPVPATVDYLYNRWQTNTFFPVDFSTAGAINSLAHFSDQAAQNTTARYSVVNSQQPLDFFGLFTSKADLNPLTFKKILGIDVPAGFNKNFLTSTAQLHYNFPQNATVVAELKAIVSTTVSITASASSIPPGGSGTFTVNRTAGLSSNPLTVALNVNPRGPAVPANYTITGKNVAFNSLIGMGTVTMPAGVYSVPITLKPNASGEAEAAHTFPLFLETGSGYTVSTNAGMATLAIQASGLVVTNTNAGGDGSLAQAVANADSFTSGGTITFASGTGQAFATPQTIAMAGTLTLKNTQGGTIVIVGPSAGVTLAGNAASQHLSEPDFSPQNPFSVITVAPHTTALLSDVTISQGFSTTNGGGIDNSGTLVVIDSTISGNIAGIRRADTSGDAVVYDFGGAGGGIANEAGAKLTLSNVNITGNSVGGTQQKEVFDNGVDIITTTAFEGLGGGIANEAGATLSLDNTRVSSNTANYGGGGGIFNNGTLTIGSSIVSINRASCPLPLYYVATFSQSGFGDGGGIFNSGTLTLNNDTLSSNTANFTPNVTGPFSPTLTFASPYGDGGAIFNSGMLMVNGGTVAGNSSLFTFFAVGAGTTLSASGFGDGGGIFNTNTLSVTNASISNNSATFSLEVFGEATFAGNIRGGDGGGIFTTGTLTTIGVGVSGNAANYTLHVLSETTFAKPPAGGSGGGISNQGAGTVNNATLSANTANYTLINESGTISAQPNAGEGGGIDNRGSLTLGEVTIAANSGTDGGGIDNENGAKLTLSNVTVSGNTAGHAGGVNSLGSLTLNNTIVAGNVAPINADIDGVFGGNNKNMVATGGASLGPIANYGGPLQTVAIVPGSPAIGKGGAVTTLASAITNTSTTMSVTAGAAIAITLGNYLIAIDGEQMLVTKVSGNTLTIKRGYNNTTSVGHAKAAGIYFPRDERGFKRPSGAADIGAFQTQGSGRLVVTTSANPSGGLLGGEVAGQLSLRDAVNLADVQPGRNVITFAAGTGQAFATLQTIALVSGLMLDNTTTFSDPVINGQLPRILPSSITINGPAAGLIIAGGGSGSNFSVFTVAANTIAALNGLSISHGHTAGGGGGIDNDGTLTVTNAAFSGNSAGSGGGGIENHATLTLSNVTFTANAAGENGGGIDNELGATVTASNVTLANNSAFVGGGMGNFGSATLNNLTFTANTAAAAAGLDNHGSAALNNVTFLGNVATSFGAGAGISNSGTLTVQGSTISGNSTHGDGAGIYNSGLLTVTNTVIDHNSSLIYAGGVENTFSGLLTIANSTIDDNSAASGGGLFNSGTVTLTCSSISGNSASSNGGGIFNSGPLTIQNCTLSGNSAQTDGGGIYAFTGALTSSNVTLSSNSALAGGGIYHYDFATLTLNNSMVAGNTAGTDADLHTGLHASSSGGNNDNFVGSGASSLAALGNYGGPTQTIALSNGSPAIAAGAAVTTLTAAITDANSTTIKVKDASAVASTPGSYLIQIDGEKMLVTNVNLANNTFTVVRGYNSTSPASHTIGAGVYLASDQRGLSRPSSAPDLGAFQTQGAQQLVVTSAADPVVNTPLGTFTGGFAGQLTLREAVNLADALPGAHTITFGDAIGQTFATSQTIALSAGLNLNNAIPGASIAIVGRAAGLTIAGGGASSNFSVFTVAAMANAALENLTISQGHTTGEGGGILNAGTLTVNLVTLSSNSAHDGGGLDNSGKLTLINSTIAGNSAVLGKGGGINNEAGGTLTVSYATISGNSAPAKGADIENGGALTLDNTIVINVAPNNIDGPFTNRNNVIGNGVATLAALANNGGPTKTVALKPGSPALAKGKAITQIAIEESVGPTDTTINVNNAAAVASSPGAYVIQIDGEQMLVTDVNLTTNRLTVQRGYFNTAIASHNDGAGVYLATDQRGVVRSASVPNIGAFENQTTPRPLTVSLGARPSATVFGQTMELTAAVSGPVGSPAGTVLFLADNNITVGTGTLSLGVATIDTSALTLGSHSLTAIYLGQSGVYGSSTSSAVTVNVARADTTLTGSVSPAHPIHEQAFVFAVTVRAAGGGSGMPTGFVQFQLDGNAAGEVAVVGGMATLSLPQGLDAGVHVLTAVYLGDGDFNPSSPFTLDPTIALGAATISGVVAPGSPVVNQPFTFTAAVSAIAPASGEPTGFVQFQVDSNTLTLVAVIGGQAALNVPGGLSAGAHVLTATYVGDDNFSPSSVFTLQLTIAHGNTTVTGAVTPTSPVEGQPLDFTATVNPVAPASGAATGFVQFQIDNGPTTNAAINDGQAVLSLSNGLAPGSHLLTAKYLGDANFNASATFSLRQTINDIIVPFVVLSAAPSSSSFGQTVHLSATVTGSPGTPTGAILFLVDNNTLLGTASISGGSAAIDTTALAPGNHFLTAVYLGDGVTYGSSTSQMLPFDVAGAGAFLVTNTSASGPGSLAQAILDANAHGNFENPLGAADVIDFDIPVDDARHFYYLDDGISGHLTQASIAVTTATNDASLGNVDPDWRHSWFTIVPASSLPALAEPVVLDGSSQPGASANTNGPGLGDNAVLKIELDGTSWQSGLAGLTITAPITTVQGLAINHFFVGIELTGATATGDRVQGVFVGTDVSGLVAIPNGFGIALDASNNTIGGTAPAERNVISGNLNPGIELGVFTTLLVAQDNLIEGNFIGTDASGAAPLGNQSDGIFISQDSGNTIGGTTAAARNIISGNRVSGVAVATGSNVASGNVIEGNYIGTDVTGTLAVPNGFEGVFDQSSPNTTIGGASPGAGNLISGNLGNGITMNFQGDPGNVIQGNRIGTAADGISPLGNGGSGIFVGTNIAILDNVIAFNGSAGVVSGGGNGNAVLGNSIFSNLGRGITIGLGGFFPANDPGDADTGPNNLQNFPVITSASSSPAGTTIHGTFNSTPSTNGFLLQFFASPTAGPSGHGQGQTFLGATTVNTDEAGNALFTYFIPAEVAIGQLVTATATDPGNNTSEFSQPLPVSTAANTDLAVSLIASAESISVGDNLTYTLTVSNNGPGSALEVTLIDWLPAFVTLVSASFSDGSCAIHNGEITLVVPELTSGAGVTLTLIVTPTSNTVGAITDTASVKADTSDPDSENNTADVQTINLG